jgi:hypothetical protein
MFMSDAEYAERMFICDEENQILRFLGSNRKIFFSSSEISRKAGSKKQFLADPRWASPFLASLADKHLIERNESGHCRLAGEREP